MARLNEHTQYLRTLGGKLAHELRTPLTIVRSSLDNLESEGLRADQRGYVTRAREGVLRLQSILSALGAAARVEESIKQAERVNFDLNALLHSAVGRLPRRLPRRRASSSTRRPMPASCAARPICSCSCSTSSSRMRSIFARPRASITVRLARSGSNYELAVINDGPPIPTAMLDRLFESLFEHRQGRDDKPHFGLGLYIVRLIAEFHGGKARRGQSAGRRRRDLSRSRCPLI